MGQPIGGGSDTAVLGGNLISGSFSGMGQSSTAIIYGTMNVSIWGTFSGSVQLERSFDGGTTWLPCSASISGTVLAFTAAYSGYPWAEIEHQVAYRLNCTSLASGTISYRVSLTSDAQFVGGLSR